MVKLFCSEVVVDETSYETLISVFCREEGTSFVINIKDLSIGQTYANDDAQRLLAEELQEAVARFHQRAQGGARLVAV